MEQAGAQEQQLAKRATVNPQAYHKLKTTKQYVSPADLGVLYAGLGDKEAAFQSLARAYAAHGMQLWSLKVNPHYDSLRADPRFAELMRRVGL
jgi:hypothetical protein